MQIIKNSIISKNGYNVTLSFKNGVYSVNLFLNGTLVFNEFKECYAIAEIIYLSCLEFYIN